MASHKASTRKGFTLVEILVVVAMFTIVGGIGLLVSMDSYRGSSFYADRNLFVATLERARAEAIHNICFGTCIDGKPHGVHIASGTYTVFQGISYAARDATLDATFSANSSFTHTGLTDVVFTQLSGTTTNVGDITLSDKANHVSTTTIGSEGQITWTH